MKDGIFIKAAKLIHSKKEDYGCHAIERAEYEALTFPEGSDLVDFFTLVTKPEDSVEIDAWYDLVDDLECLDYTQVDLNTIFAEERSNRMNGLILCAVLMGEI